MNWFKTKPKPKEEHPMQEEWERVCKPEPPQGGCATLPVSVYTGLQYDPEWGVQFFPLLYRSGEIPFPRVDHRLIGKDYH